MSAKKNFVIGSALAGLSLGIMSVASNAHAEDGKVKCWGVNKCGTPTDKNTDTKDRAACTVTKAQIEAAQKAFPGKFVNSTEHKCAGYAKCAADNKILNHVKVDSEKKCAELKGFLITKDNQVKKL